MIYFITIFNLLVEPKIINFFKLINSLQKIFQITMEADRQDKQTFLRQQILQQQYDAEQFIMFMNQKLNIGDDLDLCSFQELKKVVREFQIMKNPPTQEYQSTIQNTYDQQQTNTLPIQSSMAEMNVSNIPKPKQVLFTKYNPNVLEPEFSKSYQCKKIQNKFADVQQLRVYVTDPQRKTTGGFFGIGKTSFLQFKVRTPALKWQVGRRYSDFIWLRQYLIKMYPSQIVPPIPEKKAAKRTKRHVEKRMKILQYFLNDLLNIPQFLNNKYVQAFLSVSDGPKFNSIKSDAQKSKGFTHFSDCDNYEGIVNIKLTEQNNAYYRQMQVFVPKMQTIYKQLTRNSKGLQNLFTQQVNTLYQMGNLFAQLHQGSRQILNKLPKSSGLKRLNQVFITSNNMLIEWGNVLRNQHDFLQKNFNTFFKYIRNQLHGYSQVQQRQQKIQQQFAKTKINLQKKKEKIYNLHDVSKWDLSPKQAKQMPKQIIHDKAQAFKLMLPKQNRQVQRLRDTTAFYINQLHKNSNCNFERSYTKFCENFKQLTIKMKVNTQQLAELWNQMSASFAGENKKIAFLKEKPVDNRHDDQIMED